MYRISALEGQLRLCHEKLVQSHRKHDEIIMNERMRAEESEANLKKVHSAELEQAYQRISELEESLSRLQKLLEKALKPNEVGADGPIPEGSPSRRKKHKRKEEGGKAKEEGGKAKEEGGKAKEDGSKVKEGRRISEISPTHDPDAKTQSRRRASLADITAIDKEEVVRSLNLISTSQSQRSTQEKLSITELVAESLKNPSSVAAIRKELKSDAFTPKIQRKFPSKLTPTTLPSMAPNETSPLAKESLKASPKRSRSPHNDKL